MTGAHGPERYAHLDFNAPLAPWRADRLVSTPAAAGPASIVDTGCGWGELLARVAAAVPEANAVGVDEDAALLARGRAAAAHRGLSGRVRFVESDGASWTEAADLVVCVGTRTRSGAGNRRWRRWRRWCVRVAFAVR